MRVHGSARAGTAITIIALSGGCALTSAHNTDIASLSTKDLSSLSSAEKKQLKAATMKGMSARTFQVPTKWPQTRRWSPRRFFGPLYGNSPDLHLNGDTAAIVFNSYFLNHPDAAVFRKYFGTSLPSNIATLPEAIPGVLPANGFRDLRLTFDQLTYSSRYGGTFRLLFRSLEDLQIEYRKGTTAWDIHSLDMAVYVRPSPQSFNPNSPLFSGSLVGVEFDPQGVIAYTVNSPNNNLTLQSGDPLPALQASLAQSAQTMIASGNFSRDVTRLGYGLVHAAFFNEIGLTNNVTGIEISDGFFIPRTSPGVGLVVVDVKLADVRLNTEPADEEIYLTLSSQIMYGFDGPTFAREYSRINDGDSTGWKTAAIFPVEFDCPAVGTVILVVSAIETDAFSDDRFATDPFAFQTGAFDCAGMQAAFNSGTFGVYRTLPDQPLVLVDGDDDVAGALTAKMRVSIIKR